MNHPTDRITHTTAFVTPIVDHWLEREIAQWVHHEGLIQRPIAPTRSTFIQRYSTSDSPRYNEHVQLYIAIRILLGKQVIWFVCVLFTMRVQTDCNVDVVFVNRTSVSCAVCLSSFVVFRRGHKIKMRFTSLKVVFALYSFPRNM